jgi:hypothetical protein
LEELERGGDDGTQRAIVGHALPGDAEGGAVVD